MNKIVRDSNNKATLYIRKMYRRITKKIPLILIPKDTIKYVALNGWVESTDDLILLCNLVYKAIKRYPASSYELAVATIDYLDDRYKSCVQLCWAHGYFSRIIDDALIQDDEIDVQLESLLESLNSILDKELVDE